MIISTCKSTSYLYICYCLDIAYMQNYNPTLEKKKQCAKCMRKYAYIKIFLYNNIDYY